LYFSSPITPRNPPLPAPELRPGRKIREGLVLLVGHVHVLDANLVLAPRLDDGAELGETLLLDLEESDDIDVRAGIEPQDDVGLRRPEQGAELDVVVLVGGSVRAELRFSPRGHTQRENGREGERRRAH
jgi:hypothetical protein